MPKTAKREAAIDTDIARISPLEFLLSVMRDESQPIELRVEAAKAAAPHVHETHSITLHKGDTDAPIVVQLDNRAGTDAAVSATQVLGEGFAFKIATNRKH